MEPIKDAFHRRLRFGHEVHAIITGVARAATAAGFLIFGIMVFLGRRPDR